MDATNIEAIIFRSDIIKYFSYSHYPYIDIYFKYVYYILCIIVTVWLDSTYQHWSVEASSHHSDDGRRPETSCSSAQSFRMGIPIARHN
jgi:hypothetical protein